MKTSPADYFYQKGANWEPTAAQVMGTLIHAMLLEPDTVDKRFYRIEGKINRATKIGKEAYAQHVINAGDKIIIPDEGRDLSWKRAENIAHVTSKKEIFKRLMSSVESVEEEIFTECKMTGLKLKGKIDIVSEKSIVDLKTVGSIGKAFYNIRAFDYLGQIAFYDYLVRLTGRLKYNRYLFFVETVRPYKCKVIQIAPEVIKSEHEKNLELLHQVKGCLSRGEWPDRSNEVHYMGEDKESSYDYDVSEELKLA